MDLHNSVQKAKEKDSKAFDALYTAYYPQMLGVCMNIIREDKTTASDLVHDAFILAFVSLDSLKDNTKFGEWLTSIVKNVSLRYVGKRDKVRLLSVSSLKEEEAVFIDSSPSPDEDLYHKQLLELIGRLPEGYSKVLRLSVIEGFSHKEIADMLGIEPHSSSSQLARAKRLLRRMMDSRVIGVIVLLLLPIVSYLVFRQEESPLPRGGEEKGSSQLSEERLSQGREEKGSSQLSEERLSLKEVGGSREGSLDSAVISLPDISEDVFIAETDDDSASTGTKDSVVLREVLPHIDMAEDDTHREKRKWQITVGGSLGPALTQSESRILATNSTSLPSIGSDVPEPDGPTYVVPDYVNTWEDYASYLKFVSTVSDIIHADTIVRSEIAEHNTGKIVQREHHDMPITLGISLSKQLGRSWSLETGLQYSLLKSDFQMGENGYSINTKQKAHYLGIPLRVSYRWLEYRNLSAYSSLGVTMHLPVYGKQETQYLAGWQSLLSENQYFMPSLQWQTGVSFGLQYKFAPHTSLFAEPSFNWFIPNDSETHTSWTEHPFMFNFSLGIRVSW